MIRKNLTYILISFFAVVAFFITAGVCNQCGTAAPDTSEETTEDEETTEEETTAEETTAEEITEKEEKEVPTIELRIYEGPVYKEESDICYYRVEAIVTGKPAPEVGFSKDDSGGAWGKKKAQVNLTRDNPTYTLTATATNSEGDDEDSILLEWGCGELTEEHTVELHPTDVGWVDSAGWVDNSSVGIGDTSLNTDARGFFAFNISSFDDKNIVSAEVKLETPDYFAVCNFKGDIQIYYVDFLPGGLTSADYSDIPYSGPISFDWDDEPLSFSGNFLIDTILDRASIPRKLQFGITYANPATGGLAGTNEGRVYSVDDITLKIIYEE